MLYNPPSGSTDANAPYVGKNVAGGTQGSKVPPAAVEYPQRELVALIAAAGLSPTNGVLVQAAIALARGVFVGNLTGAGDLPVATLGVVFPQLLQGMKIGAVATATNTFTSPKLRVLNLGSIGNATEFPILKEDGSTLAAGEIKAGRRYRFEADGAGNVLITGGGIGLSSSSATGSSSELAGQFQIKRISDTEIRLMPAGAGRVFIAGTWVTIPAVGVPLSNAGLNAVDYPTRAPRYYLYASGSGPTLEASTTGHAADATYGHRIKSGDPTRTLVGQMVLAGTPGSQGTFPDPAVMPYLATYPRAFRSARGVMGPSQSTTPTGIYTTSTTPVELAVTHRIGFVTWDDELCHLSMDGWGASYSGYVGDFFYLYVDGALDKQNYNSFQAAGYSQSASISRAAALSEGFHWTTLYAQVNNGTAYYNVQNSVGLRN